MRMLMTNICFVININLKGPPTKPTGPIVIKEIFRTSLTLEWKPPRQDVGSKLTGYIIERRDAKRTLWMKLDTLSADITSYCAQNLLEGTEYYFRISGENKLGVGEALEMDKSVIPKSPFGMHANNLLILK